MRAAVACVALLTFVPVVAMEACADSGDPAAAAIDGGVAKDATQGPAEGGALPDDGGALSDAGPDVTLPRPPPRIFAHNDGTLFLFNPETKAVTRIGDFSAAGPVNVAVDVAVLRDGGVYVATFTDLYRADPSTAALTKVSPDSGSTIYPNGLAFVPAGVIDPSDETLVGYLISDAGINEIYVRIDTSTGTMTPIGSLNAPDASVRYALSGDIVSVGRDHNRTYVAGYATPFQAGAEDSLLEIDPKTGTVIRVVAGFGEPAIYGLGFWDGVFYGFGASGDVIALNPADGGTSVVARIPVDGGQWYGAGVTSEAPLAP